MTNHQDNQDQVEKAPEKGVSPKPEAPEKSAAELYLEQLQERLTRGPEGKPTEIPSITPKKEKEEKEPQKPEIKEETPEEEFKKLTGTEIGELTEGKKITEMNNPEKSMTVQKLTKFPPYPEEVGKQIIKEPLIEEVKKRREET